MIDPRSPNYQSLPPRDRIVRMPGSDVGPPAVSVITAFFNPGEVVRETAMSVLEQTLTNWEWLIVDDASTDADSVRLLDELATLDPRIRVIRAPHNAGPGAARNLGARHARATVLFFLDADDLIEPTMLEKVAWQMASRPDTSAVSTYEVGFGAQEYLWPHGFHTPELFLSECPVGAHAVGVRAEAFARVGGFDESIRGGMEDWDLWFRFASAGLWGTTIPEYLSWYRRRDSHAARWADWDGGERQRRFHQALREKYAPVFARPPAALHLPDGVFEPVRAEVPVRNSLRRSSRHLLMIVPWLTMGGSDKFNLHLVEQLRDLGWEITIATTLPGDQWWHPQFTRFTRDVFITQNFLRPIDVPVFLRGLIESRRPDAVYLSHSELAYWLLWYLRAHCPEPAYVDYIHMEEEYWKNGGYPRYAAGSRGLLDMTIASSEHLRRWVISRGGDPEKTLVCTTNEDTSAWKPDATARRKVRAELGLSDEVPVILYAGRICSQKQPQVFAQSLNRLAERGMTFTAVVAGDGADRPVVECMLRGLIDRGTVRMLGAVPNARMKELCASADIFFLPSLWEGISLAVYEAMASGLAIVGADVGGQRELVTPETGFLIQRSTPEAEAEEYAELLARLVGDEDLRRRMGRAARERIEGGFRLVDMGRRMDELIRQAIDTRGERNFGAMDRYSADESAARAVEHFRIHGLADHLWVENARLRAELAARVMVPQGVDSGVNGAVGVGGVAGVTGMNGSFAASELTSIERSLAWRAISGMKRTAVYEMLARARWGDRWDMLEVIDDPHERLARIKASRSFRFISAVKGSSMYRAYASLKRKPG